jgi:hypothetical protein
MLGVRLRRDGLGAGLYVGGDLGWGIAGKGDLISRQPGI